jgi:hypothetical protein
MATSSYLIAVGRTTSMCAESLFACDPQAYRLGRSASDRAGHNNLLLRQDRGRQCGRLPEVGQAAPGGTGLSSGISDAWLVTVREIEKIAQDTGYDAHLAGVARRLYNREGH